MPRLQIRLLLLFASLIFAFPALAQTNTTVNFIGSNNKPVQASSTNPLPVTVGGASGVVPVEPHGVTTTVANSTISVTNTFQAALAASATRLGATLQNQGTHVMYVYFGTIGDATTAKSLQLQAGQTISAASGVVVLTDAINITGIAGDPYVVNSQ